MTLMPEEVYRALTQAIVEKLASNPRLRSFPLVVKLAVKSNRISYKQVDAESARIEEHSPRPYNVPVEFYPSTSPQFSDLFHVVVASRDSTASVVPFLSSRRSL